MNITGCTDHTRAKFYIDSANGDIDAAVISFFESAGDEQVYFPAFCLCGADYLEFFEHFYGSVLRLTYILSRDHQVINRVVPLAKLQLTHLGLTRAQMSTTLVVLNLVWLLLLHHHSLLIMTNLSKTSSRYLKRFSRTFMEIFIACKRISWSKGSRGATRASQ